MSYRFTHKNKWQDDWFLSLSVDGKVLFDYLTDNCDNAGFIEISKRLMCFMIMMDEVRVNTALEEIEKCYIKSSNGKFIWLRKFLVHQKNIPLNEKNNYHKQIIKIICSKLEVFNNDKEILNILPEETRKLLPPSKGVQTPFKGGSKEVQRGLEGAEFDENSEKSKENLAPSVGLNKPLSISISINKDKTNTNTIINNASDDFEKKSSSLLEKEKSGEENSKKNENSEPEFVEAEEIVDEKNEKEKKVAPKKEKEIPDNQHEKTLHTKLKTIFLDYYKDSKQMDYYWNGKDGKNMNEIIKKLKFHLKPIYATNGHADEEIAEQDIETAFSAILMGLNEEFTIKNLSVSLLNSRFQENLTKIKSKIGKKSEIEKKRYDF